MGEELNKYGQMSPGDIEKMIVPGGDLGASAADNGTAVNRGVTEAPRAES